MAVRAGSPRIFRRALNVIPSLLFALLFSVVTASAEPSPSPQSTIAPTVETLGSITGAVTNPDGFALSGADVVVEGPSTAYARTERDGRYTVGNLTPGQYSVSVVKASYVTFTRTDVTVAAGVMAMVNFELAPATFTSLHQLGHVTVSARSGRTINTSTAAIVDVPTEVFRDQGQQQVTRVLNETPGIVTTVQNFGFNNNGAYPSTIQEPQIRGCLNYETESLIDGHPISIGSSGFYSPLYLNPHLLQGVEVVKGPGSMPTDINYAVCGSVNYRTLSPTRTPQESVDLDFNSYTGLSSNYQATGSTPSGRIGYAFDYAIIGQPGPFKNDNQYSGTLRITPTTMVNGQPICGPDLPYFVCAGSFPATPPGQTGALAISYPIVICCSSLSDIFVGKAQLGKIAYNFSPETSLTTAFLGAQAFQSLYTNYIFPQQSFDPYNPTWAGLGLWPTPSSGLYTGSLKPGFATPYATLVNYQPDTEQNQQGLLESELRSSIGKDTLLFRYYTGAQRDIIYNGNADGTGGNTLVGQVWGLLPTGPGGVFQSYNGQMSTITQQNVGTSALIEDHFSGYSTEADIPNGLNLYTVSYDDTRHNSFFDFAGSSLVPNGASQALSTVMLRGSFTLKPQLTALFGNYFVNYTSHYTPDGGATWLDAGKTFYGPRLALTWQPKSETSIRASMGSSIAPPFLVLVNAQGGVPLANNQGAVLYYTQTLNNGNISPETAFGLDLGVDHRINDDLIFSGDVYQTDLHGQFLNTTSVDGTYTPTSGPNAGKTRPLYITKTANLGQSRYQGLELTLRRVPETGFGFKAQGALIRAYTYNLPPGFWDTANGPNTTNLAVIPNANFYGSGNGYNGIADGNVPYAQGYAEANYRTRSGGLFLLGATYYGNNNSYNAPAFFVVSASARVSINDHVSVQLTGDNLTDSLGEKTANLFGGKPVPLVNGTVGVTTAFNVGPPTAHFIVHISTGP